jgi:hypothetical protein
VQDGRVYILDGGNRAGTFAKALELEWKEELGEESTSFEGDRKFCLEGRHLRSCMRCTAARDKYWQKTRKTIVSKAHATWWVRRKVVVERGGVLCCIVVLVRKKENVREPEAKSRFMVVARSLVHCLLVRFGNSPRMECNQMNLCRVCAAEQA